MTGTENGGRSSCITCHDPHYEPSRRERAAYYRTKCMLCHTEVSCSLPLQERLQHTPPDDCAECHMPKVKLPDIPHAALTDHQIIAREGEPYPTAVFRQSALQLHGLIYLDGPPTGKPSIPPIVLLQAYGELRKTYLTYESFYKALLSRLANTDSENILVQRDLALEALQNGTPKHKICAIRHLSQAIKLGSTAPADYALLAGLLARAGNIHSVIILLRRGISLDPYYPQFYVSLALIYKHIREYSAAIDCLNRELSLFPEDSLSRRLLSRMAGVQRPFSQPCAH